MNYNQKNKIKNSELGAEIKDLESTAESLRSELHTVQLKLNRARSLLYQDEEQYLRDVTKSLC